MAPVLRKRKIEKDRKTTAPSEEGEMAVVDPVTVNNNRKIGWCKARRKAIKMSCIADILPQEVIFAILLLLPVDFIYHVVSDWRDPRKFLAKWGSLSMMVKVNSYLIKTWLLIDPKTGRWEKLPDINFVASSRLRYHRMPIGSLGNGELLVFEESSEIIVYHVKMGRIVASYQPDDKEYPACMYKWRCHPHVDSLVSLSPATTTAKPVEAYKK
ncbi:unnamed protein product [Cuscuta campestris]|uniref:Uncharacterized protein n=1 Tax=Cuscuta campestris TaxID=132261 RepID=A0A484N7J4_9ASTE|nr:unnamed protein product [Cuscuta campestris]